MIGLRDLTWALFCLFILAIAYSTENRLQAEHKRVLKLEHAVEVLDLCETDGDCGYAWDRLHIVMEGE